MVIYYDKNEGLAQALLDAVVTQYAADGLALPSLQLIGYAGMPLDVDMVTVMLVRMFSVQQATGPEGEQIHAQREPLWRGAEFDVVIIRCTPQPKALATGDIIPPSPTQVTAMARVLMRDPLVITRGIVTAYKGGGFGGVPNIALGDHAAIADESGGIIGYRLRVRIGTVL